MADHNFLGNLLQSQVGGTNVMFFSSEISDGNLVITDLISSKSWIAPVANTVAKAAIIEQATSYQKSLLSKISVPHGEFYTVGDLTLAAQRASLI